MIRLVCSLDSTIFPLLSDIAKEIWKRLCWKTFPLLAEQYFQEGSEPPESWRQQYFVSFPLDFWIFLDKGRDSYYKRRRPNGLNWQVLGSAVNAWKRKHGRGNVRSRSPIAYLPRNVLEGVCRIFFNSFQWLISLYQGGAASQPKTLFQKTKNEATRLRSSMYSARLIPPKRQRTLHSTPSLKPAAPATSEPTKSMVTVKTVTYKRPSILPASPQPSGRPPTPSVSTPATLKLAASPPARPAKPLPTVQSPSIGEQRPFKPPINKKDPMASLFMPKHRTLSQLPGQTSNARIMPTR
jgi:elongin-A